MTNQQLQSHVHRAFDLKRRISECKERLNAASYHQETERAGQLRKTLQGYRDEYKYILKELNEFEFRHSARHCYVMNRQYNQVWTDSARKGVINSCEHCNPKQPEQSLANEIASLTFK